MLSEDEKAIRFYKRFIETEEQELEWMYKEDEEYYRDSIEQKELLIKGWRNILNLITKLQKENEEKDKQINLMAKAMDKIQDPQVCKYCDNNINSNHGYCVDAGKCKEGIKQYFEKLAKEKKII